MFPLFFFFNDTATTEIYTLSLHDALPISLTAMLWWSAMIWFLFEAINFRLEDWYYVFLPANRLGRDRKSTRLNSSHLVISYAVFCLKKKETNAAVLTARRAGEIGNVAVHP